jgi:putative membrane protein
MKLVWVAYFFGALVIIAGIWLYFDQFAPDKSPWLMTIPLIALYPAIKGHIRRLLMSLTIDEDHITVDRGFFSRTRRTIQLAKIQDVTVNQSMGQRIIGVGDISLESAGETGAVMVNGIDRPRIIADMILERSRKASASRIQGV